ncbi:hypothetical protein TYRP_018691, partial [Tyrophagus putrescentiae]
MNSPNNSPFNSLFGHHMFCFRLQPLVTYLCKIKFQNTENHRSTFIPYWRWPKRFWLEKAVQHGFNVAICLEGLYVSSSNLNLDQLQLNADNSYLAHHPLIIFTMATFPFFSSTVLWCTCLMSVFAAYVDLTLYFRFDATIMRAMNELIVLNGRHFRRINGKLVLAGTAGVGQFIPEVLQFWYRAVKGKIWANPAVKFDKVSMGEGFSALSTQLRTRLVLYSAAAEVVTFIANCILFTILVVIFAAFQVLLFSPNSGLSVLLALMAAAELVPVLFATGTAIRQCFFLMHLVSLVSYLSGQYCAELIDQLRSLMDIIKSRNKQIKGEQQQQQQVYRTLDFLHAEYWTMLRLSRHCDQKVIGGLMFTTFACNITLNLVMVGHLIFKALSLSEQLVLVAITLLQLGFTLIGCASLIGWSSVFHRSDRLMYSAQQMLVMQKPDVLRQNVANENEWKIRMQQMHLFSAKLKLAAFYEQVCCSSSDQFHFRMGHLGKITPQSLYEFALFYTGMAMYVAKMVRKDR